MNNDIELHRGQTTVALEQMKWEDIFSIATAIADTDFVPERFRKKDGTPNPGAVAACILTGQELGIKPMVSLQEINVIKGKVGASSLLMRAQIQAAGHTIETVELTNTRCTMRGKRRGETTWTEFTFTMEDAKAQGLAHSKTYKETPRAMLSARATSGLGRLHFADVLTGMAYTPDELQQIADGALIDTNELFEEEPLSPAGTVKRQSPRAAAKPASSTARKSAAPKADPAPPPAPSLDDEEEITDAEVIENEETSVEQSKPDRGVADRARAIAMLARERDIDHHDVVAAITEGRTSSAKEVDAKEGNAVQKAIVALTSEPPTLWLAMDAQGVPVLLDYDPGASEAGGGDSAPDEVKSESETTDEIDDAEDWTGDQWRELARSKDIKIVPLIKKAQSLKVAIKSLDHIAGSGVAGQLREWLEGQ